MADNNTTDNSGSGGGGFTGLWDKVLGAPGGGEGSLLQAITGQDYLNTPQGQRTLQNLYSQGYGGQGNLTGPGGGIVHERTGLGALLQAVGILGPSTPTTPNPSEIQAYREGQTASQEEGLKLSGEQQNQRMKGLTAALGIAGAGGGVVGDLGNFSDSELGALGNVAKTAEFNKQTLTALRNERIQHMKNMEGFEQQRLDLLGDKGNGGGEMVTKLSGQLMSLPGSKMLVKQYQNEMDAAEKDSVGAAVTDPDVKFQHYSKAKDYQTQLAKLAMSLGAMQGDKTGMLGSMIASQAIGDEPVNPWVKAYNIPSIQDPNTGQEVGLSALLEKDPQFAAEFQQLHKLHSTTGGLLSTLNSFNPFAAQAAQ